MGKEVRELHDDVILSVQGERFDPDPLLPLIPLRPRLVRRKGEPVTRRGSPGRTVPVTKTGGCYFALDPHHEHLPLAQQISILLDAVEPRISELRALILEQGLECNLEVFQAPPHGGSMQSVDPHVLDRASRLGLPIVVDPDI